MAPSKHSRDAPPQISISSWIMGGPIVTKPRHSRPRAVLVTTDPTNAAKATEAVKLNEKDASNVNKEPEKPGEASKKPEEAKADATTDDGNMEKRDNEWNWTAEQDALILKLKGESVSWKQIADRMSLAKSDVQVRFKELQKKGAPMPATGKGEGENVKRADETDRQKDVKKVEERGAGGSGNGRGERLRPDDNWSRDDCEILEMLEARYREQKWLSMQASFYNLTGRMIRADIIESKLSEAGA